MVGRLSEERGRSSRRSPDGQCALEKGRELLHDLHFEVAQLDLLASSPVRQVASDLYEAHVNESNRLVMTAPIRPDEEKARAVCPITELGFPYSAGSAVDRANLIEDMRAAFSWVPVHDRAFSRAWEVQDDLTAKGEHRSAGPVDLVVAATAELDGLTLLHHDHDFATIAGP